MRTAFVAFLFAFFPIILLSQAVYNKRYTVEHGLGSTIVYKVCQDGQGFIWVSDNDGVSKFDGVSFKKKTRAPSYAISTDLSGNTWFGGYNLAHTLNDSIKSFRPINKTGEINIRDIQPDDRNRIWLLNNKGQVHYIEDSVYKDFTIQAGKDTLTVSKICYFNSNLLFATDSGVFCTSSQTLKTTRFLNLPKQKFYSIARDEDGCLYFGTTGKIFTYRDDRLDSISLPGTTTASIIKPVNRNYIWITTNSPGFFLIKNRKLLNFSAYLGLDKVTINDLLVDRSGNLFIATYGKGLVSVNHPNIVKFDDLNGLSNNYIQCIKEHEGRIYIGCLGSLAICENDQLFIQKNIKLRSDEIVNDILITPSHIWLATPYGVYKYSLEGRRLYKHSFGALALACDLNNDILVGGYQGLFMYKSNSDLTSPPIRILPAINGRIKKIVKAGNNKYYLLSVQNIYIWEGDIVSRIDSGLYKSCKIEIMKDLSVDPAGNVWICHDNGLIKLDANYHWTSYGMENGLSNYNCNNAGYIYGRLWISTDVGMCSFDGTKFDKYLYEYGFHNISTGPVCGDRDSNLWIATTDGLFKWDLKHEFYRRPEPRVIIESITDNRNQQISTRSANITLPYKRNFLAINYLLIDFFRQNDIAYRYRLLGDDSTWFTTKNRSAQFSSLKPGDYTLEINATYDDNGNFSPSTRVYFKVLQPLWQKVWFQVSVAILLFIVVAIIFYYRVAAIKRRERAKTEQYTQFLQLKQQAMTALVSPHFIFNALNSIQQFINQADKTSANRFLTRFARLIRSTMENSTKINIKLSEEIKLLEYYLSLETLRLNNRFTYEVVLDPEILPEEVFIPSLLIQPYVENAIWHGITPKEGNGHVRIEIKELNSVYLLITIEDNGVGFTKEEMSDIAEKRQSWGLKINEQRLAIIEKMTGHHVQFEISAITGSNGVSSGTLVKLHIPYQKTQTR